MHLQHKIPWTELAQCLRSDDTEIVLPVGAECGRIHLIDKATRIKVSSRTFLSSDQVCTATDCDSKKILRSFSKNKLSEPVLSHHPQRRTRHSGWRFDKLKYVNQKFYETVMEFVATEEKKFHSLTQYADNAIVSEAELLNMECITCHYHPCKFQCKDFLIFSLYSGYQIDKLLWLDSVSKVSVKDALSKTYGGQAVGNGYAFLVLYHLLPFYVQSNVIIACGYEADEHKWGKLQPGKYFRQSLDDDYGFLTFIPNLRPYLHKDVFMKDMNKTMELLRIVFRHIYVYIFLQKRFNNGSMEQIKRNLKVEWFFGLRESD